MPPIPKARLPPSPRPAPAPLTLATQSPGRETPDASAQERLLGLSGQASRGASGFLGACASTQPPAPSSASAASPRRAPGQACGHALPPNLILHSALSQPGQPRSTRRLPRALSPRAHPTPAAFRPLCELLPLQGIPGVREVGLAMTFCSFPVIQ